MAGAFASWTSDPEPGRCRSPRCSAGRRRGWTRSMRRARWLRPRRAAAALPGADRRFHAVTAFADQLPFADDTFDAVMSSFVLQLVPNRFRALREIRRVLRPGGLLAYVTWVADSRRWRPDEILDDLLDELGVEESDDGDEPPPQPGAGDLPSVESAAAGLRRAGFHAVTAERAHLRHQFDPESYTGFITEFDEQVLADSLEPDVRARFERDLIARLGRLDPKELVLESPIAYAGRSPVEAGPSCPRRPHRPTGFRRPPQPGHPRPRQPRRPRHPLPPRPRGPPRPRSGAAGRWRSPRRARSAA